MGTRPPPTRRERQVIQLACDGLANKEIATALGISIKTVEFHLTRLYARTSCSGRAHLAAMAATCGWVETSLHVPAGSERRSTGGWRR
jgi:DNA-binding CsgD family transcriptional regulator